MVVVIGETFWSKITRLFSARDELGLACKMSRSNLERWQILSRNVLNTTKGITDEPPTLCDWWMPKPWVNYRAGGDTRYSASDERVMFKVFDDLLTTCCFYCWWLESTKLEARYIWLLQIFFSEFSFFFLVIVRINVRSLLLVVDLNYYLFHF